MKCKNCGTEFEEGIFCPECGNPYNNEANNCTREREIKRAYQIITEYNSAEEEIALISGLKWSDSKDVYERICKRIEVYKKAESMKVQSESAQQLIKHMRCELEDDYNEMRKKDGSLGAYIFWACIFSLLAVWFLLPLGIIGLIIGILVIYACWSNVFELKKTRTRLYELRDILDQLQ
jgi:uncharacterized Zn finger protein (UPF0148 family)